MGINSNQRKILVAGMALVLAMALFPPWTYTFKYKSTYSEDPAGYTFIGTPPPPKSTTKAEGVKIDLSRLSIQLLAALALTGIGFVLAGSGKNDS